MLRSLDPEFGRGRAGRTRQGSGRPRSLRERWALTVAAIANWLTEPVGENEPRATVARQVSAAQGGFAGRHRGHSGI